MQEVQRAGTIVSVGDSLLTYETVPIGSLVFFGGQWRPWLRVRVHGPVMPSLVLMTAKRRRDDLLLPPRLAEKHDAR